MSEHWLKLFKQSDHNDLLSRLFGGEDDDAVMNKILATLPRYASEEFTDDIKSMFKQIPTYWRDNIQVLNQFIDTLLRSLPEASDEMLKKLMLTVLVLEEQPESMLEKVDVISKWSTISDDHRAYILKNVDSLKMEDALLAFTTIYNGGVDQTDEPYLLENLENIKEVTQALATLKVNKVNDKAAKDWVCSHPEHAGNLAATVSQACLTYGLYKDIPSEHLDAFAKHPSQAHSLALIIGHLSTRTYFNRTLESEILDCAQNADMILLNIDSLHRRFEKIASDNLLSPHVIKLYMRNPEHVEEISDGLDNLDFQHLDDRIVKFIGQHPKQAEVICKTFDAIAKHVPVDDEMLSLLHDALEGPDGMSHSQVLAHLKKAIEDGLNLGAFRTLEADASEGVDQGIDTQKLSSAIKTMLKTPLLLPSIVSLTGLKDPNNNQVPLLDQKHSTILYDNLELAIPVRFCNAIRKELTYSRGNRNVGDDAVITALEHVVGFAPGHPYELLKDLAPKIHKNRRFLRARSVGVDTYLEYKKMMRETEDFLGIHEQGKAHMLGRESWEGDEYKGDPESSAMKWVFGNVYLRDEVLKQVVKAHANKYEMSDAEFKLFLKSAKRAFYDKQLNTMAAKVKASSSQPKSARARRYSFTAKGLQGHRVSKLSEKGRSKKNRLTSVAAKAKRSAADDNNKLQRQARRVHLKRK